MMLVLGGRGSLPVLQALAVYPTGWKWGSLVQFLWRPVDCNMLHPAVHAHLWTRGRMRAVAKVPVLGIWWTGVCFKLKARVRRMHLHCGAWCLLTHGILLAADKQGCCVPLWRASDCNMRSACPEIVHDSWLQTLCKEFLQRGAGSSAATNKRSR